MDSSGTLYRLIEEMNRKKRDDLCCGTMSAEDRERAIDILLSAEKPIENRSIDKFRRVMKRRLRELFRKP